jgi:hypothetical protein
MLFTIPEALLELAEEDIAGIDKLMAILPDSELVKIGNDRSKWRVVPGGDGTGRVAFAVLRFDRGSGEQLVLGCIESDVAPEHEHIGGEVILTLAGIGNDITDKGELIELRRNSVIVHGAKTIHAPGSRTSWTFLYYQPEGNRPTSPAPKA